MNGDEIYQDLFELMEPELPGNWTEAVLYAEYGESSYEIEFFVKDGEGGVMKCYDLPGAAVDEYYSLFEEMDSILSKDRSDPDKGQPWSTMTMTVKRTGDFKVDYTYDDVLEDPLAAKDSWRKQYLD